MNTFNYSSITLQKICSKDGLDYNNVLLTFSCKDALSKSRKINSESFRFFGGLVVRCNGYPGPLVSCFLNCQRH